MGPPGVPKVPIFGPNRGMFLKLNWPVPLGSGGHSHTIFSNGRFQGTQRSFGGDVKVKLTESLLQIQYHYKFSAVAKARLKYLKDIAVNCYVCTKVAQYRKFEFDRV